MTAAQALPRSGALAGPEWTGELTTAQQAALVAYVGSHFAPAKRPSVRGSYGYKHDFGHEPGAFYCKFEDFGRAMLEAGFKLAESSEHNSIFYVTPLRLPRGVPAPLGFAFRRAIESSPYRVPGPERRAVANAIASGYYAGGGALWLRYCAEARVPMVRIEGSTLRAVAPEGESFPTALLARVLSRIRWATVSASRHEIVFRGVPATKREQLAAALVKATQIRVVDPAAGVVPMFITRVDEPRARR